jgi:hemerythrin
MGEEIVIGVEEIDRQHQELFRHMHALRDALQEGAGSRDEVLRTVRFLGEFTTEHFSTEERWMRRHNYPGILIHEKEHQAFLLTFAEIKQKVQAMETQHEMNAPLLAIEIERKLEDWLKNHIEKLDKKLGEYLVERSVA